VISTPYSLLIPAYRILHALDTKQQGLLAKHPANPNPTTNNPTTATKPASSSLKDTIAAHKRAKATGIDLPLRPRTVITTKATGEESTQHASVGVGIDLPLRPQSIVTTKATGEESTQHASVAGDTAWVDDLFIEKPVKAVSKPQPQQDSIFGAKRAKDAQETPQNDEQVSKSASLTATKRIWQMLTRPSAPEGCGETAGWPATSSSQAPRHQDRRQVSRGCLFHQTEEEEDESGRGSLPSTSKTKPDFGKF